MILVVSDVLSADDVVKVRERFNALRFIDGSTTAGWHAKLVKNNLQADRQDFNYAPLNKAVTDALMRNPTFRMAGRPKQITPLLFSKYTVGMTYGTHVDDAIMYNLRSDISFTIFLADPESYDGGELVMELSSGEAKYKLKPGQMLMYPSTTLHRVEPISRGERIAIVGWCQSFVRHAEQREVLYELDVVRRAIFDREGKSREFDVISRNHANLQRMWSEL